MRSLMRMPQSANLRGFLDPICNRLEMLKALRNSLLRCTYQFDGVRLDYIEGLLLRGRLFGI